MLGIMDKELQKKGKASLNDISLEKYLRHEALHYLPTGLSFLSTFDGFIN